MNIYKKTAQNIAATIPCSCSDCGMDEPAGAKMIQEYSNQQLAEFKAKLLFAIDEELEKEEKAASIPLSYVHPTMYYNALQRVSKLIDSIT
jgi:hypothetical protein